MPPLPQFLHALDLQDDADERAVRRAYAKRLKQIDQIADPQGLQALRTAYEAALQWVALKAQRDQAEPVSIPDDSAPDAQLEVAVQNISAPLEEHICAHALGDEVFAEFAQAASSVFEDETAARNALELSLADDRLINLEARTFFEWRVACLIVEGWQPGHEFLFEPACACFNWEQDRRRLVLFGQTGAVLNAAIEEKLIFFRQAPHQLESYHKVILHLRVGTRPDVHTLLDEIPLIDLLAQRHPHWLYLVTSRANIINWHRWLEEVPQGLREAKRSEQPKKPEQLVRVWTLPQPRSSSSWIQILVWVTCALTLIKLVGLWMSSPYSAADSNYDLRSPEVRDRLIKSLPSEPGVIGNVRFAKNGDHLVVDEIGPRTSYASTTLQPDDLILSCGSGYNNQVLIELAELKSCSDPFTPKREGETLYLFRIQRGTQTMVSSATVRD